MVWVWVVIWWFAFASVDVNAVEGRERSLVFPIVLQAIDKLAKEEVVASTENRLVKRAMEIIQKYGVSSHYILKLRDKLLSNKSALEVRKFYLLPASDEGDRLLWESYRSEGGLKSFEYGHGSYEEFLESFLGMGEEVMSRVPEIAIHAYKVEVLDPEDDLLKDDLYLFFFVTDGVLPMGRVTSVYKGSGAGDAFFLSPEERLIYPSRGWGSKEFSKVPEQHLIIDYGIVESDCDDIKDLQAISQAIIELTFEIYALKTGALKLPLMLRLRKEVKNLSDALMNMNSDDRLVLESIYYRASDFAAMFREMGSNGSSVYEFQKRHSGKRFFSSWDYRISFRVLKNQ
ncbi:MAG: hypothetical protein HQK52_19835 [Oligoflexia bacterium]|nr:hypothetical protein [Oligoflexia bacterium]